MLELLAENGMRYRDAGFNGYNSLKYQGLIEALGTGSDRLKIAIFLLENGADPNYPQSDGMTPIHSMYARENERDLFDIFKCAMEHGLDVNREYDRGTLLHYFMCLNPSGCEREIWYLQQNTIGTPL